MGRLVQFLFFVLFYQIVVSSSLSIAKSHLCPHDQSTALLQFKQAITVDASASQGCEDNGQISSPKTASWNRSADCCRWDGVTCDKLTGKVIALDLSCSQLQGVMDSNSSLFQLSHLQRLNLAYNNFSALEISRNFGELSSLTHLNLSSSGFSGQLPTEVLRLSNLISLDLSLGFQVIKIDPRTFRLLLQNLTRLRDVSLSNTDISSFVPSNISASIAFLNLGATLLYGKLPDDIFHLQNLQRLQLFSNPNLTGQLPTMKWKSSSNLRYLDLSLTGFSGEVPESIGSLRLLNYLDLSFCNFWGSIPESLGNLTQINYLLLFSNNFTGRVPSKLASLDQLIRLDLSSNALRGQIPNSFGNFRMLTHLSLSNNFLSGSFPSSVTNLTQLQSFDLSNNSLAGPISHTVSGFLNISSLFLADNSFNGTIPSWVFSLPSLRFLSLRSNELTGQIYEFQSQSLRYIDLSENKLNGSIPRSPSKLENLDLSSNKFEGEIPDEIGDLLSLRRLNLSHNILGGQIPPALGNLSVLESLDLSSNQLGGGIAQQLTALTNLSVLNLSENHLVGKIPPRSQFTTFENRSYIGNPGLCGYPLSKDCVGDGLPKSSPPPLTFNDKDEQFLNWEALLIGYSFGMMLGVVAACLMFITGKPKWLNEVVQQLGNKMNRKRRKEIRWIL